MLGERNRVDRASCADSYGHTCERQAFVGDRVRDAIISVFLVVLGIHADVMVNIIDVGQFGSIKSEGDLVRNHVEGASVLNEVSCLVNKNLILQSDLKRSQEVWCRVRAVEDGVGLILGELSSKDSNTEHEGFILCIWFRCEVSAFSTSVNR